MPPGVPLPDLLDKAEAYAKECAGPGWHMTRDEWSEWSNDLARLIPEGDESTYSRQVKTVADFTLLDAFTGHCFWGWCSHTEAALTPDALHAQMERHYSARHQRDIAALLSTISGRSLRPSLTTRPDREDHR